MSAGGGDVSPYVVYWCRDRQIRKKQMLGTNTRFETCKNAVKGDALKSLQQAASATGSVDVFAASGNNRLAGAGEGKQ